MNNLAFYASPVDFQKNDKLNNKLEEVKKSKMNADLLKKLSAPNESKIQNIHNNVHSFKEENENDLADFYNKEMNNSLEKQISESQYKQTMSNGDSVHQKDYLISNNLDMNKINADQSKGHYGSNKEILHKLNYIINMFEKQKEVKTNQKNEEVVLYCFLGIFVIYVLDSFVYIGKYSR